MEYTICQCCKNEIDPDMEHWIRIERGTFNSEDRNDDYIKAETIICSDCYLTDPDLCAFFNKIGRRVR